MKIWEKNIERFASDVFDGDLVRLHFTGANTGCVVGYIRFEPASTYLTPYSDGSLEHITGSLHHIAGTYRFSPAGTLGSVEGRLVDSYDVLRRYQSDQQAREYP